MFEEIQNENHTNYAGKVVFVNSMVIFELSAIFSLLAYYGRLFNRSTEI